MSLCGGGDFFSRNFDYTQGAYYFSPWSFSNMTARKLFTVAQSHHEDTVSWEEWREQQQIALLVHKIPKAVCTFQFLDTESIRFPLGLAH